MTTDEPDPQCPSCHADLAHGDAHSTGCPMDLPGDDDTRPIAEERMVLGAMLLSSEAVNLAATTLRADHFTRVGHRDLFEAILELWSRGDSVDPVSVSANLAGDRLIRVGGAFYVHSLMQNSPTSVNVAYYAELIRDRFRRAEIVHTLHRAIGVVQEGDHHQTPANLATIGEMLEAVLSDREVVDDEGVWLHEAIDDEVASWDEPEQEGLMAGFADFDDVVSGFRPGQMVIVAARPGIGKSALATDWCRYAAERKASVLLFSLEMPRREVMQRLISAKAKVRLADIRANTATDHERHKMRQAAEALHETFFRIEDGGAVSLAKLRTVARKMKRSHAGLDLVVVDYLQLMSSGRKVESRQQEVSEFSRGLKLLAKELGVPVVALSQLNRGPETRADKKPMLSDLRESGSLEQDADIVVLISRPDAVERDDPRAGEADLILAKNRNGPTGTIAIAHQLHYSRFADLARG